MDIIHYNGDLGDGENVTSNDNGFLRNKRIYIFLNTPNLGVKKKPTTTTKNG